MSTQEWQQLRELFDSVCDHAPGEWRAQLQRLTSDTDLVERTLELLHAQTMELGRMQAPLQRLMAKAVDAELQAGDCIGPWRLTERLASGGMGTVFLAQRADDMYTQKVAVKLLHGLPSPRISDQLAAERRILAGLQHPNVARLYDGGTTPAGHPYLVMEYVDGQPLNRYCEWQSLDLAARLRLFLRICGAVQAAHENLVIHCDLKPANVLVKPDGEPVLLDFGVARLMVDDETESERAGFCTPAYASPEMVSGNLVGVAADVFGLGVMLVEMLARRPLERTTAHVNQPVPLPSQWALPSCPGRRSLSGDLDAIAAMACALDPSQRYASVAAFANDIRRHLQHRPVHARSGSRLYRTGRGVRRHWRAVAVLAVVAMLTSGFVWRLMQARAEAEEEALVARHVTDFLVSSFEAANPRKRGGDPTREITAREMLDAGAARINVELADLPAEQARLKAVLGEAYQHIGQPRQAELLLTEAADTLLVPRVNRPLQAAGVLSDLAVGLSVNGRANEAEMAARRALSLLEDRGAEDARAHALNSLGLALTSLQRYDEAEAAFNQSLAIRNRLSSGQAGVVTVKFNLGLLYKSRGDYVKAERRLREALDAYRSRSPHSPQTQGALLALAATLVSQGRLEESASLHLQGLELARLLYGEDSSRTAVAYGELAGLYQDMGQYARAAQNYRAALKISAKVDGEDSINHALNLNNFATLEEDRGDVAAAESLYRQSWTIRRARLGEDAPASLRAQSNLGRLLMRRGRMDEALPLLTYPFERWSATLQAGAPDLRTSALGLVEWEIRNGNLAQARTRLVAVPAEGASAVLALRRLHLLAELAQRAGDPGATKAWWRVVEAAIGLHGASSVSVAKWRILYAEALQQAGDLSAARAQLTQAVPRLRAQLVPHAEPIQRAEQLARLLRADPAAVPAPAGSASSTGAEQ